MRELKEYTSIANDMQNTIKAIRIAYSESFTKVGDCDKETQDILHKLELETLTYHETAKLGLRLKEVRKERRINKDITEALFNLIKMVDNGNIEPFLREIQRVYTNSKNLVNRTYVKRSKNV